MNPKLIIGGIILLIALASRKDEKLLEQASKDNDGKDEPDDDETPNRQEVLKSEEGEGKGGTAIVLRNEGDKEPSSQESMPPVVTPEVDPPRVQIDPREVEANANGEPPVANPDGEEQEELPLPAPAPFPVQEAKPRPKKKKKTDAQRKQEALDKLNAGEKEEAKKGSDLWIGIKEEELSRAIASMEKAKAEIDEVKPRLEKQQTDYDNIGRLEDEDAKEEMTNLSYPFGFGELAESIVVLRGRLKKAQDDYDFWLGVTKEIKKDLDSTGPKRR